MCRLKRWLGVAAVAVGLGMAWLPAVNAAEGEISITKSPKNENPKLFFAGISGDENLNKAMRSLLLACGWFDVVKSPDAADFTVSGSAAGGQAQIAVTSGGAAVMNQIYRYTAPRQAAQSAIDAMLVKIFGKDFNVQGVASSQIAFCAETAPGTINIYLCDIDGGNIIKLTDFSGMAVEPSWFPDGKSLAYTKYNRSNTSILQTVINPRKTRVLANYNGMNVGAAINPGGNAMALVMSKDRQVDLYVRTVTEGQLRRLTNDADVEASPTWNPDSTLICFASGAYSGAKLYTISPNGGTRQLLPRQKGDSVKPSWSKDNKIVYSTKRGGEYTLAVVDMGGAKGKGGFAGYENNPEGLVFASNPGGNWESASWAPDNRHVVVSRRSGKSCTLHVVDTWTGKTRTLLTMQGRLLMPSWSPLQK